jgi:hypothetical protein
MKPRSRKTCACGCGRAFRPKVEHQRYVNPAHQNKAAQARFRERVKAILEAVHGA